MERRGEPPAPVSRRPGRPQGISRRFCLILVLCWAVPGTGLWGAEAFLPQSADGWTGWVYAVPRLVSLAAELTGGLLLLAWLTLPVLLLAAGFDYVRGVDSTRWWWRGAWIGVGGAAVILDALMLPLASPFMAGTPNWDAFAESVGFVAVGTGMIFVLSRAATRSMVARSWP